MSDTMNRSAHAREVARILGYTIADMEEIFKVEDEVELQCLRQGITVKRGKLYTTSIVDRPARKRYNGVQRKMFDQPARKELVVKKLGDITKVEKEINEARA